MDVSSQIHDPAALPAGKNPGTYCMRVWMDPRASLGFLENRKFSCPLLVFETPPSVWYSQ